MNPLQTTRAAIAIAGATLLLAAPSAMAQQMMSPQNSAGANPARSSPTATPTAPTTSPVAPGAGGGMGARGGAGGGARGGAGGAAGGAGR